MFTLYSVRKNIVTEANSLSHQAMRIKIENDLRNKHQENTVDIKRELTKLRHRNEDLEGKNKKNQRFNLLDTNFLFDLFSLESFVLLPIKIDLFCFFVHTNKHFNLSLLLFPKTFPLIHFQSFFISLSPIRPMS